MGHLEDVLADMRFVGLSENTQERSGRCVQDLQRFVGAERSLATLDRDEVRRYLGVPSVSRPPR